MARVPLTGGAYQAYSVIASAQRSLNLFAEPMPQGQGEPGPAASYPTPGLQLLLTLGDGPVRGILQAPNGIFYVVSGSDVWRVEYTGSSPLGAIFTTSLLGSITAGLTTPVSMADNGLDMVIVDGHFDPTFTDPTAWSVNLATDAFSVIPNGGFFVGADRVDYLDGYFIFNQPFSQNFWISQFMSPTFDPAGLDFAAKITHSDLLITLIVSKRLVYLFGSRMTEIWYNAGATDIAAGSFPFAEMQSEVIIDHGTTAKYSPAVYDNSVFWLAHNRAGEHIVIQATGYQTKRVSTYAIESWLGGAGVTDDAIGFCYLAFGHAFYVLTFPTIDHTWVYDITTGLWHEWLWMDPDGVEHRHRAMSYSILGDVNGVGDWQNGNVYALYGYTDNGQPIKRVRSFPHLLQDGRRMFWREFVADMETGNVPDGAHTTLLDASFTVPDGTPLDSYTSDVGGGWTRISGTGAEIETDTLVGNGGGATLYQSAVTLPGADYSLHFDVVPPAYDSVVADTSLWAIGRASGAGDGYRVTVSADGTQYTLTLDAVGGTATASVAMGTIPSGRYTVWLVLAGALIAAQVQRSVDSKWLTSGGTWAVGIDNAAQFTDATYSAAGSVMIGGTWP